MSRMQATKETMAILSLISTLVETIIIATKL